MLARSWRTSTHQCRLARVAGKRLLAQHMLCPLARRTGSRWACSELDRGVVDNIHIWSSMTIGVGGFVHLPMPRCRRTSRLAFDPERPRRPAGGRALWTDPTMPSSAIRAAPRMPNLERCHHSTRPRRQRSALLTMASSTCMFAQPVGERRLSSQSDPGRQSRPGKARALVRKELLATVPYSRERHRLERRNVG